MKIKLSLISLLAVAAFADVPFYVADATTPNSIPYISDGKKRLKVYPIAPEYRLKEFGGQLDAIDAYSDGVGVYVGTVNPDDRINSQPLAELVDKYGDTAKANRVSLIDEVSFGSGTAEDKEKLAGLFLEGSACDDGSPISFVSTYVNGSCVADKTEGTACDDLNPQTSDDKWTSGTCTGGVSSNPFLTYDGNYLGLTETEAANMKAYLGLSNFDLTLLPNGHTQLKQSSFWGSNYKHLLVLVRTSTGDLIGGYTGENYFGQVINNYQTAVGGEFIFNATKGIKQLLNTQIALLSNTNYSAIFGLGHDICLCPSPYATKRSYGAEQTVNILGIASTARIYFTPSKYGFYIVTPK